MDYLISRFNSFALGAGGITENNIAAHIKNDFTFVPDSEILVICLPGWGGELNKWKIVKKFIINSKASFLAYEFPRGIFSDQMDLTRALFGIVNITVRNEIKRLKNQHGFKKCVLIGVSLASSYGSMIYKDNSDINEIILVAPGENLARDMWHGCRTQHFRKSYERRGITEVRLMESWRDLASQNNIPDSRTRINFFFGKNDEVIPYKLSQELVRIYQQRNIEVVETRYPLGHYLLISFFFLFPKYFLVFE